MASSSQHLTTAAWELKRMRSDLRQMRLSSPGFDWFKPHPAPRSLNGDELVTPWRFAAHFLSEFEIWRSAVQRWETLFGPGRQPDSWRQPMQRCIRQVQRILGARGFHQALFAEQSMRALLSSGEDQPDVGIEGTFTRFMLAQQKVALARIISSAREYEVRLPDLTQDEFEPDTVAEDISPENAFDIPKLLSDQSQLHRYLNKMPPATKTKLEWHLCQYRAALLQATCLQPDGVRDWPTHLLIERSIIMKLSKIIAANPQLGVELNSDLSATVDTLEELISQLGFEGAWEQLTRDEFESLPLPAGRRKEIAVIPNEGRISSSDTVLALFKVAASKTPATGFRRIMAELKSDLVRGVPGIKNVIIITDWWNAVVFAEEHSMELNAWRQKGVQMLVLLVSQPGSFLTPLRVWN